MVNKYIKIINDMTPKETPLKWFDDIKQPASNIQKILESTPKKQIARNVGSTALRYAPITGDLIDIGAGVRSISQGHPWIGAGQLGLGGLGLLGSMATLPAGGIGSALVKAGIKKLAKQSYRALPKMAKYVVKAPIKRQAGVVGLEMLKGGDDIQKQPQQELQPIQQEGNSLPPIEELNIDPANIEPFSNISQGANNYVAPLPPLPDTQYSGYIVDGNVEQPQQQVGLGDISKLLEIYGGQINKMNQPYIEALQDYLNNYNNYIDNSERRKRFYAGLAGLSGNNNYAGIANDYNPVDVEANKLNLLNQLLQTKYSNFNAINNLLGNATIAQQLGLPAEASLADKNLLNAYTSQQRALYGLEGKKYSSDLGYKGRLEEAYIDNATKRAIEQGRIDNAIALQQLKNNSYLTGKTIDASAYGMYNPQEIDRLMRQYGVGPARGLNYSGLPATNQQQGLNNLDAILQGRR